jgi:hypothetical protein
VLCSAPWRSPARSAPPSVVAAITFWGVLGHDARAAAYGLVTGATVCAVKRGGIFRRERV